MALDATVAGAAANSYLTVAAADALADEQGLGRAPKEWLKAHFDDKERALIRATREVDAYVGTAGTLYATTQALLFPRAIDVDAALVPYIIPAVRMATFEQAMYVLLNADLIDDAATRRARGLVQFSDDDGSGSVFTTRIDTGMSPQALSYLSAVRLRGRGNLYSVPVASSYST